MDTQNDIRMACGEIAKEISKGIKEGMDDKE